MSDDQLFDWDVPTPRAPRPTNRSAELVARPPGYHLIVSREGPRGFHRSRVPEAAMAKHGSCVTLCGIVGRRVSEYPKLIPLCDDCEIKHTTKAKKK